MTARTPTGGKGSNQYATKGAPQGRDVARRAVMGDLAKSVTFDVEQVTVTKARVRPAGDLSFVVFPDETVRLIRTADVERSADLPQPISWLQENGYQWGLLNPGGPDIWDDVAFETTWNPQSGQRTGAADLKQAWKTMTADEIAPNAFRMNNGLLFMYGEDRPRNRVLFSDGVLADWYDLDKAEEILEAHPWVKHVASRDPRVGHLAVHYKIPDDIHDAYFADVTIDDKTPNATPSDLSRALTWAGHVGEGGFAGGGYGNVQRAVDLVGHDPFGLAAARHDED